jgi:hypothetical protein
MFKKKLLVIAGAGASIEFGMPSVKDVGDLLIQEAQMRFPLANDPRRNLYSWLVDEVTAYWGTVAKPSLGKAPNFEDIMYAVFLLTAAYPSGVFTSPLGALVAPKSFPDILWLGKQQRSVDKDVWRELGGFLSDTIIDAFRDKCRQLEPANKAKVDEFRAFFRALSKRFHLAIVILNYDDIIHRSIPGLTTGFGQDGVFRDELLFRRRRWPCILHLHGSVHFDMRSAQGDLHNVQWQENLSAAFNQNSAGRSPINSSEGTTFPQSVIVAGHGKTSQILRRPFRSYYSELDRLVSQSDALLCLGYGFGDVHLNMAIEAYRDHRQRPVVLVDYAADNAMSASAAHWDDPPRSIVIAMEVLMTDARSMCALSHSAPSNVEELKKLRAFDLSNDPKKPLAIWYNGMREACRNPDKLLTKLWKPRWVWWPRT